MKKIKFSAVSEKMGSLSEPPTPSIKMLPQWYKKMSMRIDPSNKSSFLPTSRVNDTMKTCIPIFDAMTAGYMLTLPCDVEFVDPEAHGGYRAMWKVSWPVVSSHSSEQIPGMELPSEYERDPLKWNGSWNVKPPKGYSLLYTHPFYRYDLPFISATGIVDADIYDIAINIPFFIKKNFYGIVPRGTPIAQVIPIKRESWKSYVDEFDSKYEDKIDNVFLQIRKSYKNRWWQRKRYS